MNAVTERAFDIVIRKVFKHGKSYTITLPKDWDVPDILNVYTNNVYFIYSPIKGLETTFKAERVAQVKKRIAVSHREYTYYLLTIPKKVVYRLGIRLGSKLFVLRTTLFDAPTFICVTRSDIYEKITLKMIRGDINFEDLFS